MKSILVILNKLSKGNLKRFDNIKSVDAYQYRRIRVPNNSRYIRITTTTKEKPIDLYIHHFRIPTHCTIKNIKYTNCRSVALAPAAMNKSYRP